jgi:hypothetical protein
MPSKLLTLFQDILYKVLKKRGAAPKIHRSRVVQTRDTFLIMVSKRVHDYYVERHECVVELLVSLASVLAACAGKRQR